ncbi:glutamate/aspartate transport system substrate-binding protein [Sphingobium sp. B11D3B]|uniref:transporter substrate-binding domain-containing protein n=1 Tax=Sphingobium sp. B11D3B TaxID=2940575 RepID=UPI0022273657|nr:transporter substrate-binding domain-containing protein [Sphingobium sp. B11D3B]MCW2387197.1 glutamate/aspartate transport system substrate-binding protein [Sphingobium sp. B11D3B]
MARTIVRGVERVCVRLSLAVALACSTMLAGCGNPDHAASTSVTEPTLERIRRTGEIALGHRENSIPFSYFDNQQHVVGYAHDISMTIAREVGKELGIPNLRVRLVPITSQTRIPLLLNGTIDLECGTTTNNRSRGRQIAFSTNYFMSGTRFLVRRDSGVHALDDLRGRNVVVAAGTTSEVALRTVNVQKKLGIRVIAARDHGDAFVALEFGKAIAFMSDDAILYGELSKAKVPGDWHVVGEPLTEEVYGCGLRKQDPTFKALADRTIIKMMRSGAMRQLYARWFQAPIPPRGVNLAVPFSAELASLFAAPNDRPLQ